MTRSFTRHATLIALVLMGALPLGGCPDAPETEYTPISEFDFAELHELAAGVLDLTNFSGGKTTSASLVEPHADDHRRPSLIYLPEVDLWYLFLDDAEAGQQIIYLPGTSNVEHLRLDIQLMPVFDERIGANLHTGFRAAARRVYTDLQSRLHADRPVTLVGYSLGGGVAVILGKYLALDGFEITGVVTLGQPAITDAAGHAAFADLPLLRIVAGNDVIPRATMLDYEHFGETLILLDGPYVVHRPMVRQDMDLPTSVLVELNDQLPLDHFSYRLRLESKLGATVHAVRFAEREAFLASEASLAGRITPGKL